MIGRSDFRSITKTRILVHRLAYRTPLKTATSKMSEKVKNGFFFGFK